MKITSTHITFCLSLFCVISLSAQIGVGTITPQQELHVAGPTSTIRVDGLNDTNNAANLGGAALYNLAVDANGDIRVGDVVPTTSGNLLSSTIAGPNITVFSGPQGQYAERLLTTRTFTVVDRSLVIINRENNITTVTRRFNTAPVDDGRAKMIYTFYRIIGPGFPSPGAGDLDRGIKSNSYTNYQSDLEQSEDIIHTNSDSLILDPGTYTLEFYGAVYSGESVGNASFQARMRFSSVEVNAIAI